jgi:molybdate transport system substrate-binding protein
VDPGLVVARTAEATAPVTDGLTVFAAGSLRPALATAAVGADAWPGGPVACHYANARDLADAIERGERADVFASASATHPRRLQAAGLLSQPLAFARNRLVIGVPPDAGSPIRSIDDLAAPGVRVVIEIAGVPLGDYTREAFRRLGRPELVDRIPANVVDEVQDVLALTQRLANGSADAGLVYRTDVLAAAGRLAAVELPPVARIEATYVAGVVRGSDRQDPARSWIRWLVGPAGQRTLAAAGFEPAPDVA